MNPSTALMIASLAAFATGAAAQTGAADARAPSVSVNASATATLANDRMVAWVRAEREDANAATASADVNARMARVLARLHTLPALSVQSSGYSTDLIAEKDKPRRWRVSQSIRIESADFALLATEVGTLQGEGLLLGGLGYSLSTSARRRAEADLTGAAIADWKERAGQAARGLGYGGWRVGSVNVQSNEGPRPYMAMRMDTRAMGVAAAPPPVAADAGTSDVTVNVSGDAVLLQPM